MRERGRNATFEKDEYKNTENGRAKRLFLEPKPSFFGGRILEPSTSCNRPRADIILTKTSSTSPEILKALAQVIAEELNVVRHILIGGLLCLFHKRNLR